MSNTERIQANNTRLQVCINKANSLPDAGSGSSEDLTAVLAEQAEIIQELKTLLASKASGSTIESDGVLPNGYRAVQCIKFTGAQAVNTNIICNNNSQIRVIYTRDGSANMYVYGVVDSAQTKSVTGYLYANGGSGRWRFGNQSVTYECKVNEDLVRTAIASKSSIIRANLTQSLSSVSAFTAENPLYVGACCMADGGLDPALLVGKIMAFEIWQGSELALKFIPCINDSGVCGFWDTVSQSFFASITDTPLESCYI